MVVTLFLCLEQPNSTTTQDTTQSTLSTTQSQTNTTDTEIVSTSTPHKCASPTTNPPGTITGAQGMSCMPRPKLVPNNS